MDKKEIIKRHGKQDGNDEDRWSLAVEMAGEIDKSVLVCFKGLVNLEDKKLIEKNHHET